MPGISAWKNRPRCHVDRTVVGVPVCAVGPEGEDCVRRKPMRDGDDFALEPREGWRDAAVGEAGKMQLADTEELTGGPQFYLPQRRQFAGVDVSNIGTPAIFTAGRGQERDFVARPSEQGQGSGEVIDDVTVQ